MKRLIQKINAAHTARINFDSACDSVLKEILKSFDFDINEFETNFFHIEHQSSDGIVLSDSYTNVYALNLVMDHIRKNGKIRSYAELKQYRI